MARGRRGRVVTELLGPAEVLGLLADPETPERFSSFAGTPLLALDLRGARTAAPAEVAAVLQTLPCVSVALLDPGMARPSSGLARAADVVVDQEGAVTALAARAERNPQAAVALVELLRLGIRLEPHEALVAESLVYATLQSGAEFRRWLAARPTPRSRPRPDAPAVRIERGGDELRLSLDRPQKRNAFSKEMRDGLCEGLRLAVADASITSIVLRGEGPDFCSGGDLDEFGTLPDPATAHAIRATRNAGRLLATCGSRARAELHGACVGAGIELPAFCGRVVARADTRIRLPELAMGLVPGAGGTASLPRRIGRQRTAWLALSGGEIDATTALAWGLVDALAD